MPQSAVPDVIYNYDGFILLFYDSHEICKLIAYDSYTSTFKAYQIDGHPANFYNSPKGELLFYSLKAQPWRFSRKTGLVKDKPISRLKGWKSIDKIDNFLVDNDGTTYLPYREKAAKIKNDSLFYGPGNPVPVHGQKLKLTYAKYVLCTSALLVAKSVNGFIIYDKHSLKKLYEYDGLDIPVISVLNDRLVVFQNGNTLSNSNNGLFGVQQFPLANIAGGMKDYIAEPGSNNILVAAQKGIFELVPNLAGNAGNEQTAFISEFFKDKSVRGIWRLPNGKMYVGTYQGFYVVDKNKAALITSVVVYAITQSDDNKLLLGVEGGKGFATLDTRTDQLVYLDETASYDYGFCLAKDGDDYIAGGNYMLFRMNKQKDDKWHLQTIFRSDSLGPIKQVIPFKNYLWIASANGLFRLDNYKTLKKIFPEHEKYTVYTVLRDGNNFWLGTAAHGLIKIDQNCKILSQLKFSDGLAGDFVYSLFKINGLLYAGTNQGLSVFNTNAGMQSINPPDDPQYSEELNHSAIFYDEYRRQLIFGGVNGLLFPDMDYYASAKGKETDVIKLAYVKKGANGVEAPKTDLFAYLQKSIVVDPGYLFMGLKFSGGLESRQHNFLFRVSEIDTLWHKSDLSNEISFYGLAPGTYTLQARFPSVTDSRYWFTKTIIVVPHFYQSWFFKGIMALLIALAIYAAWLYRISKIRGEHLLRTTIASDLHDEIGSALTRISFSSELMNIKKKLDSNVVEKISADSKGAIASISDIIWSVDARNDTTDDLLLRIREHAGNMLENAAALHIDAHGLERVTTLPQLMRQNIYLVFKEAINNIARHNVSPEVWISLDNQPGGMTIIIKNTIDTGKEKSTYTGQGLRNMHMRAKRIKASLDIENDGRMFSITIRMRRW